MIARKIIITGPESTGKTELSKFLAARYGAKLIPEYARSYIEERGFRYTREDVLNIANRQLEEIKENYPRHSWVVYDTGLIITKVWLELVFGESPEWIDDAIRSHRPDLVLLCYPDLEWKADPARENGGEMRERLYRIYEQNLKDYAYPYRIVRGKDEERNEHAIDAINKYFKLE